MKYLSENDVVKNLASGGVIHKAIGNPARVRFVPKDNNFLPSIGTIHHKTLSNLIKFNKIVLIPTPNEIQFSNFDSTFILNSEFDIPKFLRLGDD